MARRAPLPPKPKSKLEALRLAVGVGLEQAKRGELLDGAEVFRSLEARILDKS